NGTESWVASTRAIAANLRTNAQKAKAKAANQGAKNKAGAVAKAKAKANANAAGEPLADNGVLLTLSDVNENSVVNIKTARGDFNFKLSDIPYGGYIERLNGGVEIERIAAARQLTSDRATDHDYPSAAAGSDGTGYVAYTSFTPGIDRD